MPPANPSRVPFLLGFCLIALCAAGAIPGVSASDKPNVVFILADDLGWGELGCYGQQKIPTPNIDRLAGQGMRFTQHYSGAPVCAPSRCVLMTGKEPGAWEVYDLAQDRAEANDLAATRADLIQQAEQLLRREVGKNAVFPVPIPSVNTP